MAKSINILFSSPPSIDFPQFVEVQDEYGQKVAMGKWLKPDADNPFWVLQLSVSELLTAIVAPDQHVGSDAVIEERTQRRVVRQSFGDLGTLEPEAPPPDRAALKSRLRNARPKPRTPQEIAAEEKDASTPGGAVDVDDDLAEALQAGPDEGGFDPSAVPDKAPPIKNKVKAEEFKQAAGQAGAAVASRLFDNTFHGKGGDSETEESEE